jgi:hypothetical protein
VYAIVKELWEAVFYEETNTSHRRRGCYTRAMTTMVKKTLVVNLKELGFKVN